MVQHLRFLLFLASKTFYQMDYLRARHVYCASDYLGIPGNLSWNVLGVLYPPFRQLHLPRGFVVGGLLRIIWAFSSTLAWCVPGLIRRAFLAHSKRCIGGPYTHHCPSICLLHRIGVLRLSGFSFGYHIGSRFIVCFHCRGFNHVYLSVRLLGAYLASLVLQGHLFSIPYLALLWHFSVASMACLIYF